MIYLIVNNGLKFSYELVSVKTGLNDIGMKIQITALLERINFS